MNITYIQHSCFLIETEGFYYLFDYFKGTLPDMDVTKPIQVLSSHGHSILTRFVTKFQMRF